MKNVVVNAQEVSIESGTWNWKTWTQRKNIFEGNGHKVWSKLNSVEKWSLAIWPCPGAAWVTALLPARVNTKAVYNTRERLLLRADISWLQFLLLLLLLELWDCDMMVRKPGKLVVIFQTRPGSARLACTTVLYSAELSEPRGTGGHCLPRFW